MIRRVDDGQDLIDAGSGENGLKYQKALRFSNLSGAMAIALWGVGLIFGIRTAIV
jgi:hypothetical protein